MELCASFPLRIRPLKGPVTVSILEVYTPHSRSGGGAGSKGESMEGPLTGGPLCRMSNLRKGHVNCHYFSNFHVDFKKL